MEPSVELQVDNGVSIPYHDGLSVGNTVDVTKQMTRGRKLHTDGITPTVSKIKSLSCKYCLADKFTHVCQVLDIPLEYALKVEAGLVQNDVVKTCLNDIYNKRTFKLIFRLRYIWELQEYTSPVQPIPAAEDDGSSAPDLDGLDIGQETTAEAAAAGRGAAATHVVDALYTGDELVVIMTLSTPEFDALQTFYKKIKQMLGGRQGYLGKDTMLTTLETLGASLDSKLGKSHYKSVKCVIEYGSFHDLEEYPASVSGMARVVGSFTTKWTNASDANHIPHLNHGVAAMKIWTGNEGEMHSDESTTVKKAFSPTMTEVFNLRVTLQPQHGTCKAMTEDCSITYEAIFSYIYALKKTELLIQRFMKEHNLFSNTDYTVEGEEICSRVLQRKNALIDAIEALTILETVSVEEKQRLQELAAEMPDLVEDFIKRVTTKLPAGGDINLLIIGKTGHGKSSTANTILRRKEFVTSSGAISETKSCQRSWSEVDGRTFKVVDVPGVCDTDLGSVDSAKLAVRCISEAISSCSDGFHALLLVIRYGNRMTEEEERAIYILKCILGQAIVHSHCICVVTHGDNFEDDEGSFEDWCKRQDGFLKDVFEECNYRCVLFNNKTSDPVVLKTQLIQLVSKVDSLEHRGTCYTNNIFKHAEKDRQRLIEELELPQFKEKFLKDLNLLQDDFEEVEKADENERKEKMEKLKNRTESLRLKLDQLQCGGIVDIYQAVSNFSERLHRQEEKELAGAELRLEREKFQHREAQLRTEREAMERQIAEQTERRVCEAAEAAQEKERALREQEQKNLEEKLRHERELAEARNKPRKKKSRWVRARDSVFK